MIAGMSDETIPQMQPPAWVGPWSSGDWRVEVEARPVERANYLRWWLARPREVQQLHLRYPTGAVVRLKAGVVVWPVGGALPVHDAIPASLWQGGRWGIVVGYVAPCREAPQGGLLLNDMPRPAPAQGWVHVGDVELTEGYLHGYGPEQVREHLKELLGTAIELMDQREAEARAS